MNAQYKNQRQLYKCYGIFLKKNCEYEKQEFKIFFFISIDKTENKLLLALTIAVQPYFSKKLKQKSKKKNRRILKSEQF